MKKYLFITFILVVVLFLSLCFLYIHCPFLWMSSIDNPPSNEAVSSFSSGVISSIALACAIVAIWFQKQELEATRKELHEQQIGLKNQNQILHEQQFEQTFNTLFLSYKQTLFSIQHHVEISSVSRHLYGINYLTSELRILNGKLKSEYRDRDITVDYQIRLFLNKFEPVFSQYFFLLSFLRERNDILDKDKYYKRLSDLSFVELLVIALFTIELGIPKDQANFIKEEKILKKLLSIMDCNSLIKIPENLNNICKYILFFDFISLDKNQGTVTA